MFIFRTKAEPHWICFGILNPRNLPRTEFYSSSDFRELRSRFKLPTKQIEGMLAEFRRSFPVIEDLVKRSFLPEKAQHKYLDVVADRLKALERETPLFAESAGTLDVQTVSRSFRAA